MNIRSHQLDSFFSRYLRIFHSKYWKYREQFSWLILIYYSKLFKKTIRFSFIKLTDRPHLRSYSSRFSKAGKLPVCGSSPPMSLSSSSPLEETFLLRLADDVLAGSPRAGVALTYIDSRDVNIDETRSCRR